MSVARILTPRVNANDAEAVLVRWLVGTLEAVTSGQPVCEVETTKATVEVQAEAGGFLFPLAAPGDRLRVGQPLALLLPAPDPALAAAATAAQPGAGGSSLLISEAARAAMVRHGLTDADFEGRSVVRTSDVEALAVSRAQASDPAALDGIEGGDDAVLLYGAGRHGLVVLDTIRAATEWRPVAFIDDHATSGIQGVPVFPASRLADLVARGVRHAHVSMGDAGGVAVAIERLERAGLTIVSIVHSSAVVSPLARLGRGVFVGPLVIVGPDAEIGDFTFLNNGCSVAHHCVLSTQVILADGARLGGGVRIGRRSLIGINATVNKDVIIGDEVTVVSGVAVFDNVPNDTVVRADGKAHPRRRT